MVWIFCNFFFFRSVSFKFLFSLYMYMFKTVEKMAHFVNHLSYENLISFRQSKTPTLVGIVPQPLYVSVKNQRRFIQNKCETFIIKFRHNHIRKQERAELFERGKKVEEEEEGEKEAESDRSRFIFVWKCDSSNGKLEQSVPKIYETTTNELYRDSRAIFLRFLFRFASHLLTQQKSKLHLAG